MNPPLAIHDQLWVLLNADADVATAFPRPMNVANVKTRMGAAQAASRAMNPADSRSLVIEADDSTSNRDAPVTFGQKSTPSTIDYGVPRSDIFRIVVKLEGTLADILGAEHAIEKALFGQGRTLGLSWVGSFTIRFRRVPKDLSNGIRQYTSTGTLTVESRPKRSQITA